ncbi:hypothetical protein R3P38DRAFT_2795200 [Favolaschia claudopus]|uniref:Uncharacterized protein n=1 Tax=Favolaschia claudopus TaxID=2862362 RepID=A0AAW0A849_9AGAR
MLLPVLPHSSSPMRAHDEISIAFSRQNLSVFELSEYRGSSSHADTKDMHLSVYSVETACLMAQGGCWAFLVEDRAARWRTNRVNDRRIRTAESRALKKCRDEAAYDWLEGGRKKRCVTHAGPLNQPEFPLAESNIALVARNQTAMKEREHFDVSKAKFTASSVSEAIAVASDRWESSANELALPKITTRLSDFEAHAVVLAPAESLTGSAQPSIDDAGRSTAYGAAGTYCACNG